MRKHCDFRNGILSYTKYATILSLGNESQLSRLVKNKDRLGRCPDSTEVYFTLRMMLVGVSSYHWIRLCFLLFCFRKWRDLVLTAPKHQFSSWDCVWEFYVIEDQMTCPSEELWTHG